MLIPYQVDVPTQRQPFANWLIIGVTIWLFFVIPLPSGSTWWQGGEAASPWVLGRSAEAWVGYICAHADAVHLAGNMLFLWVFGNAICSKLGSFAYSILYLGCGLAGAAAHMLFDGRPCVGASAAINGIVGAFAVWYPLNTVHCLWLFQIHPTWFSLSSYWLILMWLIFDILGARFGLGRTAYWAHLGGFFCGAVVASLLVLSGLIKMNSWEKSLFQALGWARQPADDD